jgi:hypothetical protein
MSDKLPTPGGESLLYTSDYEGRKRTGIMRARAFRLMAIRQARLELLASSASGHEGVVNGWAAASGEESVDFVRTNRLFR